MKNTNRELKFKALFTPLAFKGGKEKIWFESTVGHKFDSEGLVQLTDWLQYTEMKDSKGKEMYDGDIGKRILDKKGNYIKDYEWADFWLIEWFRGGFITTLIANNSKDGIIPIQKQKISRNQYSKRFNEVEIIGNINGNPELGLPLNEVITNLKEIYLK